MHLFADGVYFEAVNLVRVHTVLLQISNRQLDVTAYCM